MYIVKAETNRAKYGDELIKELYIQMTNDFNKNYSERNLWFMKQFYLVFPIRSAVRAELSWTHYKSLMRVEDEHARNFYIKEAIDGNWSTRQLNRAASYQLKEIQDIDFIKIMFNKIDIKN